MKNRKQFFFFFILALAGAVALQSCTVNGNHTEPEGLSDSPSPPLDPRPDFKNYWYQGLAEVNRFELNQGRYANNYPGNAVMIFVTEDFQKQRQVKASGKSGEDTEPILKLNFSRKFNTGIYPYTTMVSTFSPVNAKKKSMKVSASVDEWCGHAYFQMNLRNGGYEAMQHSYFPNEGDREYKLDAVMPEDEIWTRIRIAPRTLPTGKVKTIPSLLFMRLKHHEPAVTEANASLSEENHPEWSDMPLKKYTLTYTSYNRELSIWFEDEFPYAIVAFEESGKPMWGQQKQLTTRAVRTHSKMLAYWSLNAPEDAKYRDELGLPLLPCE